jgi:ribosome-associated protein
MEFKLRSEYIELDNLLKVLEMAASGAEAKQIILAQEVKVNGEIETRIRRKLCAGDFVELRQQRINISK